MKPSNPSDVVEKSDREIVLPDSINGRYNAHETRQCAMLSESDLANILQKEGYRLSPENRLDSPSKPLGSQSRQEQGKQAQPQVSLKPLWFTVPVPPSLNDAYPTYWKNGKMRRRSSVAVKDFKDAVSLIVQVERAKSGWVYDAGARFALAIVLRFGNNHRRDISNCVKVLEDAISETLGFDDSDVDQLYVERLSVDDKNPGADVLLCAL